MFTLRNLEIRNIENVDVDVDLDVDVDTCTRCHNVKDSESEGSVINHKHKNCF